MSHNTLITKIKQDADAEVAAIEAAADFKVAEVQRETDRVIATMAAAHAAELDKQREQERLVAVSKARQAGRIAVQRAKREQINSVFASVAKTITEQSSSDYVACFIKHGTAIVPKQVTVVTVEAPAARQVETAEILKGLGLSGEVTVSGKIKAGFVVHGSDGVYDVTLDRIMNEQRLSLEMEMLKKTMNG